MPVDDLDDPKPEGCAGVLFGRYSLWFVLVPVFAVSLYPVIHSYLEFRNETGTPG